MASGFKCSLFGFKREEVLAYINELSTNYAASLSEQEARIKELLRENAEMRQKLKQLEKQGEKYADQ